MSDHYSYKVTWSEQDGEFVGTCLEFPSLSHLAPSRSSALRGIETLVASVVADMRAAGEDVPVALADKSFSGAFMARVPGELHRRLAMEAAESGVSLNRLVSLKLALPFSSRQSSKVSNAPKKRRA